MSLLKADLETEKITDIPLIYFQQHNITAVLIDLDNTVISPENNQLINGIIPWLSKLKSHNINTCFVSNRFTNNVDHLEKQLASPVITNALKPLNKGLKAAISELEIPKSEICLIGDQSFTDVLGGNLLGLHTIKINPICQQEDKLSTFCRLLEKYYFYLDDKLNNQESNEKTPVLKKIRKI